MAERAVSLVRKMVADPNMVPRRESIALAQQVWCATDPIGDGAEDKDAERLWFDSSFRVSLFMFVLAETHTQSIGRDVM